MEDKELEKLRRRKLLELKRFLEKKKAEKQVNTQEYRKIDPQDVLKNYFIGRAWEVMKAARAQYPEAARYVEKALAKMIMDGRIREKITGEELYWLFYRLGLKVKLRTRIRILEDGKVKSIHEKIRETLS